MKFSAAAVLGFVATTLAQTAGYLSVAIDSSLPRVTGVTGAQEAEVKAGSTITFTWEVPAAYAGQQATVGLIGGTTNNAQVPIQTLGTVNVNDGKFTWSVPAGFGGQAVYGLTFTSTSDSGVMQYSPAFHIGAGAATTSAAATSAVVSSAPYGTKTISLSSHSAVYTAPAGGYTTVVEVSETTTVPCTNGTAPTSSAPYYAPPKATVPVVSVPYNNATWSTAYSPPASTGPSSPYSPVNTPATTPVTGAGARFAAPVAAVAGIFVAVFVL